MRCSRCGNENPDDNRFCGMCGASLLAPPAARPTEPQPVAVAAARTAAQTVAVPPRSTEEPRSAPPAPVSSPISGPSFLGLNDPPPRQPAQRKRASLSIDPSSAPGSNLDYLLDEEEPPHHWGIGKILVILIALALAITFGYLRWKNQGFAWLNLSSKKPSAAATNTPAPSDGASPTTPSITPESQPPVPQPAATQPPTAASQPAGTAPASSTPPSGAAPPSPGASTSTATAAPTDTAKPTESSPPSPASPDATAPAEATSTPADQPPPDSAVAATKPAAEKPKPSLKPATPKPSAARNAIDPVAEAQKYLYGRGVTQDCDRGLRLLKPEANRGNPKAMVEMGALYSAGLCTPHDLPTSYRWFALALRKDPSNTSVDADLQKLWGEMTQPERQLAIKLTQ